MTQQADSWLTPDFDEDGIDTETFAPFVLQAPEEPEEPWVLSLEDWDWVEAHLGTLSVDGYVIDGECVEKLIAASRFKEGLDVAPEGLIYRSDEESCLITFTTREDALQTAALSIGLFQGGSLREMIAYVREELEEH